MNKNKDSRCAWCAQYVGQQCIIYFILFLSTSQKNIKVLTDKRVIDRPKHSVVCLFTKKLEVELVCKTYTLMVFTKMNVY